MLLGPCFWFLTGLTPRPDRWSSLSLIGVRPGRERRGLLPAAWIGGGR